MGFKNSHIRQIINLYAKPGESVQNQGINRRRVGMAHSPPFELDGSDTVAVGDTATGKILLAGFATYWSCGGGASAYCENPTQVQIRQGTIADSINSAEQPGGPLIYCAQTAGPWCDNIGDTVPDAFFITDTIPTSHHPGTDWDWTDPLDAARRDSIRKYAGDSRGLTCDGKWAFTIDGVTRRTPFDSIRLQEMVDSTAAAPTRGISGHTTGDNQAQNETFFADGGTRCTDTDSDGMPDLFEWTYSNGADSTSLDPGSAVGRYGHLLMEQYLWGYFSDYLTIFYGDSAYLPDSIQVRINGQYVENITPVEGRAARIWQGAYESWTIGDSVQIVQFGVCPDDLGYRITWTDNSDNEEWFLVFRDSGSGKVLIDSTATNITTYDDADGREGDQYYIAAKNVTTTSDTVLVATGDCQ
jgi:hypothetical protein